MIYDDLCISGNIYIYIYNEPCFVNYGASPSKLTYTLAKIHQIFDDIYQERCLDVPASYVSLPEGSTDLFFWGASVFSLDKICFWNDFCRHEFLKMEQLLLILSFFC